MYLAIELRSDVAVPGISNMGVRRIPFDGLPCRKKKSKMSNIVLSTFTKYRLSGF